MNALMRLSCCVGALCLLTASGGEVVGTVTWDTVPEQVGTEGGAAVSIEPDSGHGNVLCVRNTAGDPARVVLWESSTPAVESLRYAIAGHVRYAGVKPAGYVELLSTMEDGGEYFTRTMAEAGPLAQLAGESAWRRFALPFQSSEETGYPTKLVLALYLPGAGQVWLGPLSVVELGPDEPVFAGAGGWWGVRFSGFLGGLGGALVGIVSAVIGCLCGLGRARRVAFAMIHAMLAVSGLLLVLGMVAVLAGQPFHVFFPLLLLGAIPGLVFGVNLRTIRRAYEQRELRRMAALDAAPTA
jgi:hypothetical protein